MTPIIGLTGGIGSGKSTVARHFASLGVPVVDTDEIAHALTAPGMPLVHSIARMLGPQYVQAEMTLDRAILRALIFSDAAARQQLEALMHPAIYAEAMTQLAKHDSQTDVNYQLLVVPLLFETNHYTAMLAQVVVVDCPEPLQIARVIARSAQHMTPSDVQAIMQAQLTREARLAKADFVILNDSSPSALMSKVRAIHEILNKHCRKS